MWRGEFLESVELARLIPAATNVNKINELKMDVLSRAIRQGFRDPVEICPLTDQFPEYPGEDGFYLIVDGHHRVEAAIRAGLKTVSAVLFNYSRKDARLRMMQTNLLRGQLQRPEAQSTILELDMSDGELEALAGLSRARLESIRKAGADPVADRQPKTDWNSIRLVYAEDISRVIQRAIDIAKRRAGVTEMQPDVAVWCAAAVEIARIHPDEFFRLLRDFLRVVRSDVGEGVVLSERNARILRTALGQASVLAESEAEGHAFSLICADFLAGITTEESLEAYG